MSVSKQPRLMTVTDFMSQYRISRTQVYREVNDGRLKAIKIGTATRIRLEDAEAWAASLPNAEARVA